MHPDPKVREAVTREILELAEQRIFTDENQSRHFEINQIICQALLTQTDVAMIDMPELLLRMQVVNNHSLAEIQQIFNFILNKIARGSGPCLTPDAAALYYFPEVFAKPRDEYVTAMLYDMANDTAAGGTGLSSITAYVGNV